MTIDSSSRANWKYPETLKFFIDLCLEEANKRSFSGNTNIDPITNKINWTDEKWEDEIKLNADVKQFRHKRLEYPEEMRALFDGILANGKDAWGPSKEGLPMDGIGCDEDAPIFLDESNDFSCTSDVIIKQEVKKRKRNSSSVKIDDIENQLLTAIKTLDNSEGPSIDECNKLLDEMQTFQEGDPLYIAATDVFCKSKTYREQWVKMSEKSEEFRKGWIMMIARKLHLI